MNIWKLLLCMPCAHSARAVLHCHDNGIACCAPSHALVPATHFYPPARHHGPQLQRRIGCGCKQRLCILRLIVQGDGEEHTLQGREGEGRGCANAIFGSTAVAKRRRRGAQGDGAQQKSEGEGGRGNACRMATPCPQPRTHCSKGLACKLCCQTSAKTCGVRTRSRRMATMRSSSALLRVASCDSRISLKGGQEAGEHPCLACRLCSSSSWCGPRAAPGSR